MSDSITKQERIEEFMRKSLLGEELINTQFHLFSSRSSASSRVVEPRVLCANNDLLAKSSKYFLDLLSSEVDPSDSSLFDLADENEVPSSLRIDDYGYGSDSDLEEYQSESTSEANTRRESKDDHKLVESNSESIGSDGPVTKAEQPGVDKPFSVAEDGVESIGSDNTAVQGISGSERLGGNAAMRLRSLGSRHILVKDTAFQTWYTLLDYLYTGSSKVTVLPLSSSTPGSKPRERLTSSLDKPSCSAKSLYRLACKIGLDDLRNKMFSFIRSHLTEQNILKELSSSLVSKHPELFEMELDVLYSYIASPDVVAGFPSFARRIANGELSHGAEIMVGIHTRILKTLRSMPLVPVASPSNSTDPVTSEVLEDGPNVSHVDKQGATTTSQPSGSNGSIASRPSSTPAQAGTTTLDSTPSGTTPGPSATSTAGKSKAPRVSLPTTIFATGSTSTMASSSAPAPASKSSLFAPISSTMASKPVPASASPSSAGIIPASSTASPFGSSSAQSFGKPIPVPTSSNTTSSSFGSSSAQPFGKPESVLPSSSTTTPSFGSGSTQPFGKPAPVPTSSNTTTPSFGSSSAQPFGKPASVPTSSNTTPSFGSSLTESFGKPAPASAFSSTTSSFLAPSAAAPLAFGLGATTAPPSVFGSSSARTAASSFTAASAFTPEPTKTFSAMLEAALSESKSGQAAGKEGSRHIPTFSFGQKDATTEDQKKPVANSFLFGSPPSMS